MHYSRPALSYTVSLQDIREFANYEHKRKHKHKRNVKFLFKTGHAALILNTNFTFVFMFPFMFVIRKLPIISCSTTSLQ